MFDQEFTFKYTIRTKDGIDEEMTYTKAFADGADMDDFYDMCATYARLAGFASGTVDKYFYS